jgi:hypothetical protein
MYDIVDGDIFEVILYQTQAAQAVLNTFHFVYRGTDVLDADLDYTRQLANAVGLALNSTGAKMREFQTNNIFHDAATAQKVYPLREIASVQLINLPGEIDTEVAYPVNVAAVLQRIANTAKRGGQGRIHMAGIPQSYIINSQLTAVARGNQQDVANTFDQVIDMDPINPGTQTMHPVVWSRTQAPNTAPAVLAGSVQATSRVMRRRTVGRGI